MDSRTHWSTVYQTKDPTRVSWYQERPEPSLRMIEVAGLPRDARVLDVGGGTSALPDALLDAGYRNVGVLDVAPEALAVAQARLGERAAGVEWFASDVLAFESPHPWELWHDRAVFHFLTEEADRARYRSVLLASLAPEGQAVIATFGPGGPERCSGLPVRRYDADALAAEFAPDLRLVEHHTETHTTPGGGEQEFLFARFARSEEEAP